MFKDRDEALREMEQALLEEEEYLPEEDEEYLPEEDEEYLPEEEGFFSGEDAFAPDIWNGDDCDADLEAYAQALDTPPKKSLLPLAFVCLALMAAIVAVLGYWVLGR